MVERGGKGDGVECGGGGGGCSNLCNQQLDDVTLQQPLSQVCCCVLQLTRVSEQLIRNLSFKLILL